MKHLMLTCVCLFIILILANTSNAKIDPESVMAMWLFDSDEKTIRDSSPNGNDGNPEGNPEWVKEGKFGGAMRFDAVDDIIKIPMTIDYDEITVMCWVIEKGSPVRPRIVSNDHTDVSNKGFQLMYNTAGSGSWFDIGTGAHTAATFAYVAEIGEWYHYTGTYDGSAVRAFIDGEQMVETGGASGEILDSAIDVHIGSSTYAISDALKGVLDEVAIFNKALGEEDIQSIMANGLEKATGLLAVSPASKLATCWSKIKQLK